VTNSSICGVPPERRLPWQHPPTGGGRFRRRRRSGCQNQRVVTNKRAGEPQPEDDSLIPAQFEVTLMRRD